MLKANLLTAERQRQVYRQESVVKAKYSALDP